MPGDWISLGLSRNHHHPFNLVLAHWVNCEVDGSAVATHINGAISARPQTDLSR